MITAIAPERELATIISFVTDYFQETGGAVPKFSAPVLETALPPQLDRTGYMPVTGHFNGWIGLSLSSELLCGLLRHLGEEVADEAAQLGLVNEMTGSITSNAREHFGERLLLHPPLVSSGSSFPAELEPPPLFFRLPFGWGGCEAYLLVALHL